MKTFNELALSGGEYIEYISKETKIVFDEYSKTQTLDFPKWHQINFCIGDFTSKIRGNEELKMLIVFSESYTNDIVESLFFMSQLPFEDDNERRNFNSLINYWKNFDSNNKIQPLKVEKSGCYIATMVYGNYNHPQVLILRDYRDNTLLKSHLGRLFVKTYYAFSPFFVQLLKRHDKINHLIKKGLDNLIKSIESKKTINK